MRKIPSLIKAIILMILLYLFLKFGIRPPLPFSIMFMYVGLILSAILVHMSVEDEKLRAFFQPVRDILVDEEKGAWRAVLFGVVSVSIGYFVFSAFSSSAAPPAEFRVVHPAPPGEINFRGRLIEIVGLENPLREDEEHLKVHLREGAEIYYRNCFFCHGDKLDGKGHFAHGLNPPPADFTDPGTIAQLQESFLFWRIAKGGPGLPSESAPWSSSMPAWEHVLSAEEIWKVILYLYEGAGISPRTWE